MICIQIMGNAHYVSSGRDGRERHVGAEVDAGAGNIAQRRSAMSVVSGDAVATTRAR